MRTLALALAFVASLAFAQQTDAPPKPGDPKWRLLMTLGDIYPSVIIANSVRKKLPKPREDLVGDPFGLVGVRVYNDKPDSLAVVSVEVDELAEPTKLQYKLPKVGYYTILPKVRWKYTALKKQDQPVPTTLKVGVKLNEESLGAKQQTVRVHSVNDVPIFVRKASGGATDLSWMLAAYVNEEHPWIDGVLQDGLRTGIVKRYAGYQVDTNEVNRQVAAIYTALQKRGIVYSSITQTSTSTKDPVISQHVRFVSDSVKYTQANCIDGVVLMASILRKIDIEPIIITGPGHAMLGYHVGPRSKEILVVETTLIGTADFVTAAKAGGARFKEWRTKYKDDPRFKEIEVAMWRDQGVMPISR